MPSWKKVITSGSNAALNSLNVTTSLTASGIIYPTTDGASGQVVTTDGNGNLSFSNVENTTITVKNMSGATIAKGTPCYITGSGTSGNLAGVWPADASNPLRMPAGVIAGESLTAGAEGVGLINGFISGVNTSAFAAGDSVYVAVGGGYTNVRPTGSSVLIQKLGNVEKSHASNGSGVINGPGYYNEVPNIQQGYTWVGNNNGVAVAVATSSIQNVVSSSYASTSSHTTAIAGTTNYVSKFTGTGTLGTGSISDTGTQVKVGNFTLGTAGTTPNVVITGSTRFSGERNAYITIYTNGGNYGSVEGYGNGITLSTVGSYSAAGGRISIEPQSNSNIVSTVAGTGVQTWSTGGSERMRITSTGDIGIGTTSPAYRLDVSGSTRVNDTLTVKRSTANSLVEFRNQSDNLLVGAIQHDSAGGVSLLGGSTYYNNSIQVGIGNTINFLTNGTGEKMRITDTGNVGIGIANPNSKLEVYDGDISVTTANTFSFLNSNRNFIPNTGGVSLGALRFRGYSTGTTYQVGAAVYSFSQESWNSASTPGYLSFQTTPSGSTSLSEKMIITAAGNVGIGTSSPNEKLEINGNLRFTTSATVSVIGSLSLSPTYAQTFINSGDRYLLVDGYTNSYVSLISETGSPLEIRSGDNTNQLHLSTAGNVGIGTASPAQKLHVSGSTIITGTAAIGTGSLGPNENTLTLGARDTSNEGGQIGFNAPGGTYTSASFIDNWQNKARILKGNNTTSTGLIAQWDIHTTQMQLAGYTSTSSFPGTATANLAVDSSGNVITVSTTGGSVFPYTGNAVITGSLTVTQPIYVPINGGMYFQGGDDAALYDINLSNHMGIYGVQDSTVGSIKLGSGGGVISGKSGNIGIGTTNPTSASLTVNGNVWATSFTGSLQGNASTATTATTASYAATASFLNGGTTNAFIQNGNSFGTTALLGTNDNNSLALETSGSTRMFISSSGNVGIGTTTPSQTLEVKGADNSVLQTIFQANSGASVAYNGGIQLGNGTGNQNSQIYHNSSGDNTLTFVSSYSSGTGNKFIFAPGGTERVRFQQNGNVGIGTTTPSASLHVYKGLAGTTVEDRTTPLDVLVLESQNTSQVEFTGFGQSIVFRGSTYNDATQRTLSKITHQINDDSVSTTRGSSLNFQLATGSAGNTLASRMYIDYAGNVGIGTTSPVSIGTGITTLDIQGSGAGGIAFGLSGTKNYIYGASTMYVEANTTAVFATNGSEKMRITSAGNVGIGTTTPTKKLQLNISASDDGFLIAKSGSANNIFRVTMDGTNDRGEMFLNNGGTAIFAVRQASNPSYINTGNNFGIGTTTPNAKLDVNGDAIITGSLTVTGRITAEEFHTEFVSSSIIYQSGSTKFGDTSDDVHQFTGSLRVNGSITGSLFGTSSWAQNAVTASYTNVGSLGGFIQGGNSFGATAVLGTNDSNSLALETNGSTKMFISSSGNVGIGTTTPSASLQVENNLFTQVIVKGTETTRAAEFLIVNSQDKGLNINVTGPTYASGFQNSARISPTGTSMTTVGIGSSRSSTTASLSVNTNTNRVGINKELPNETLDVNGNTIITGSLLVSQSLLQYSNVASVTSGSTANVASFTVGSYTAAFFDYVATSGTNARAGSVFTVWNGANVEYAETSTNDIGSTSNLVLSASVSAGAVRLQATSLSGSWSVKTLARML